MILTPPDCWFGTMCEVFVGINRSRSYNINVITGGLENNCKGISDKNISGQW